MPMKPPHPAARQENAPSGPRGQRGMVTAAAVLFLIATVIYVLTQMLNVSAGNVSDGQRQFDGTAALFLAESGLETAQASLSGNLVGTVTNSSCTSIGSSFSLGGGTVVVSASSSPATCSSAGSTPCTACAITSTGKVGVSTRQVTRQISLTTQNGTFCNGTAGCADSPTVTWQLKLKNASANPSLAFFDLTFIKQGNNSATCAAASNCQLQLALSSPSNGANSVGLQGNVVSIPSGQTYPIYQVMGKGSDDLAEVGAFFPGTIAAPTLTGPSGSGGAAYWDSSNTTGNNNHAVTSMSGSTNDGTLTSSGACSAPSASGQTCTDWCYAGDTLVFGYTANVTGLTDQVNSVTFNSGGTLPQNVALTRVAKYPNAQVAGAPVDVEAEVWYAQNPNLTGSSPLAVNASSYKGRGTAAVGAAWTSNNSDTTHITGTTLTVGSSFHTTYAYPLQIISVGAVGVGDTVSSSGGSGNVNCSPSCPTITAQLTSTETGGALGGMGTYTISASQTVTAANNRAWKVSSKVINVTTCTICDLAAGDALPQGLVSSGTISSQASPLTTYGRTEVAGGLGRYTYSGTAAQLASASTLYVGTPGTTLYLPATSNQPSVTTPAMRIALKSGTGALAANTTVTAVATANAATKSFTVSTAPTTALDGATLCAGTCAFFVPGGTTAFTVGITSSTNEWASGFVCMTGVGTPQAVTSSSSAVSTWSEQLNPAP
jgi:hypothetical protein